MTNAEAIATGATERLGMKPYMTINDRVMITERDGRYLVIIDGLLRTNYRSPMTAIKYARRRPESMIEAVDQ